MKVAIDENTLIVILTQIREALGVGMKPMLSELPDEARKIRERADDNTIVCGQFRLYRRKDKTLCLRIGAGDYLAMNKSTEENFEKVLKRFFEKYL